jgi:hypothetical protein
MPEMLKSLEVSCWFSLAVVTANSLRALRTVVLDFISLVLLVSETLRLTRGTHSGNYCQSSRAGTSLSLSLSLSFSFLEDWLGGGKSLGGIAASPGMFWELNIYYDGKGRPVRGSVLTVHKTFAQRPDYKLLGWTVLSHLDCGVGDGPCGVRSPGYGITVVVGPSHAWGGVGWGWCRVYLTACSRKISLITVLLK